MNRSCDLEIRSFVDQLHFCDFARIAIENVPPAILGVLLRKFCISCKLEASDAEFIRHAMILEDAWSDGEPLHVHEVAAFISVHGLSPEEIRKLRLLPESLTGLVVRSFEPKGDRPTWSACFVARANAMERAWSNRAVDACRPRVRRHVACGGVPRMRRATFLQNSDMVRQGSNEPCTQVQNAPAGALSRNF